MHYKKTAPKGTAQYLCFNSYALPYASFEFIKNHLYLAQTKVEGNKTKEMN